MTNAETRRDDAAAEEAHAAEAEVSGAEGQDAEVESATVAGAEQAESEADADQAESEADADQAEAKATEVDPRELIKRLEAEKMRIAADFANYQKRVNRDRAKWTQDAVREAVASLLPVLDSLEHAVAAFEGEVKDPQVYRQGVELVQGELLRVLGLYQLEAIAAEEGTPFDPDLHQAISVLPAEDVEEEVVAMLARTGYKLGETVLRAAQVVVKKPTG